MPDNKDRKSKPATRRPPKAERAQPPRKPSPAYLERRKQGIGEGDPSRGAIGQNKPEWADDAERFPDGPTSYEKPKPAQRTTTYRDSTPAGRPAFAKNSKPASSPISHKSSAPTKPVSRTVAHKTAEVVNGPAENLPGVIASMDNDKAKFLRNLINKRDRYAAKQFLVEGVRLVNEAFASPFKPFYTLYEPEMLGRTEAGRGLLLHLIELFQDKKGVFPTTEKVIISVSDTVTPQGVAAAVPFMNWSPEQLAAKNFHLVLDGLQDPGNLGTILRSAGAAGNAAVWLTEGSVDVYSPKVVRAGMGAHFRVPMMYGQKWPELLRRFEEMGIEQIFLAEGDLEDQPDQGRHYFRELESIEYFEIDWNKPSAVIIGNEAHGPGVEAWRNATRLVSIPMPGGSESLNASVAASVILFEALHQQRKS